MTTTAVVLLALAGLTALADWTAVVTGRKGLEYAAKPLTLALLVTVACSLDPADPAVRAAFVVALVLSLVGDVFLMLPGDRFVPGLVAFLAAHVAYVVGFVLGRGSAGALVVGIVITLVAAVPVGLRLLRAVRAEAPALRGPVAAYMAVIGAMVACATGWGNAWAVAGAWSFFASDSLLAEQRFVRPRRWLALAVIVTYHLAQAGLVVSLVG